MGRTDRSEGQKMVERAIRTARLQGFEVETKGKQVYFRDPRNPLANFHVPLKPGGARGIPNTLATIRRAGIEIDEPLPRQRTAAPAQDIVLDLVPRVAQWKDMPLADRSYIAWEQIRAAAQRSGVETMEINGHVYYKYKNHGGLAAIIKRLFNGIPYEPDQRDIYDYLRSTYNAMNRGTASKDDTGSTTYWLVSDVWHQPTAVQAPSRVEITPETPTTFADEKAKSWPCPEPECGESFPTREKMREHRRSHSVQVSAPSAPTPAPVPEEVAVESPEVVDKTRCGYPGCDYVNARPASLGVHRRKKHGIRAGESVPTEADLAAQPAPEPAPEPVIVEEVVTVETVEGQMTDVDAALALLRESIVDVFARHQADPVEVKTLRDAVAHADAQVEHYRRRAEAAEALLGQIRNALEELPLRQAYARIIEVAGPEFH